MPHQPIKQTCYIGLTQWQHAAWQASILQRPSSEHILKAYSRHFSSVEGNSTFYGLPNEATVETWVNEADPAFRFCFKFPQQITHKNHLKSSDEDTAAFLKRLEPLHAQLGLLCIQLPSTFDDNNLHALSDYLQNLPNAFNYGVEVRNPCFFSKGAAETALNQLLVAHNVSRISFDTRALFNDPSDDPISSKAKAHKPQLPVHAIATSTYPMVRFITPLNWTLGTDYLTPWINKAIQWMDEGRSPFFFFHTPDNADAPELAAYFVQQIEQKRPESCLFTPWPTVKKQSTLF
ncbi:DUF72 domain-containing protein [Neptuniibacter pectenicola]|uniref:DUF72 domain-containing protein n=1 Tax=Neptuniibacter pectenicola TaxID=1806669 RepID=UPI00079B80B6|nr:DUF72 domain-containing protein [Neptuniibacter pectenicola]KXJ56382.1 MAG: hypothetical protein AXW15_14310 [Neptuniibacter sp. Phe_28]